MSTTINKDYDNVGFYAQDSINGLTDDLLNTMMELIDPANASNVLDAMGGDGNLTLRLHDYCKRKNIPIPHCTLFEISRVQTEFAKAKLPKGTTSVIWGDILTFTSLKDDTKLEEAQYDVIMIKSSNHEIPLASQETLYKNLYRLLKPGGRFINLGFLFDDENERNEVRELARVKDRLAKMEYAEENRHFLMRKDFYSRLKKVGFEDITTGRCFDYKISSEVVSNNYFEEDVRQELDTENQVAAARSMHLRRNGRIEFVKDSLVLKFPGEVTISYKSAKASLFTCEEDVKDYSELYLEMLNKIVDYIPEETTITDLACGTGLLADRLSPHKYKYHGIDNSQERISACQKRFADEINFSFERGNVNEVELQPNSTEVITMINILHLPTVQPVTLLKKALEALVPGGILIVANPNSEASFKKAEEIMLQHMDYKVTDIEGVSDNRSNYWSEEGMAKLLTTIGFSSVEEMDNGLCDSLSYLAVGKK